jgi:hypothetical protein
MVPSNRHRPARQRHRGMGQNPQRPPEPARYGARCGQRAPLRLHRQAEHCRGQQPRHVDTTTENRRGADQLRRQRHQRPLAVLHLDSSTLRALASRGSVLRRARRADFINSG